MNCILVAANTGFRANREGVPGGDETLNGVVGTRAGVHVAVAAFQPGIGVRAVREGGASIFMTVGAQLGDCGSFRFLSVRIMAALAVDSSCAMFAGHPLVGGGFVAGTTQLGVWGDSHRSQRVLRIQWTMAAFASHAFQRILSSFAFKAGGVAGQAAGLGAEVSPVLLENR